MLYYRIIITSLCILFLGFLSGCSIKKEKIHISYHNYTIQGYSGNSLILLTPTSGGFEQYFNSTGLTAQEYHTQLIHEGKSHCTLINGTYFGVFSGTFQPAGEMSIYKDGKKQILTSFINPTLDQNLSTKVRYDSIMNITDFHHDRETLEGGDFYAGPILIDHGLINPHLQENISHWKGNYPRTFLLHKENGQSVLGISTEKISLHDLANKLYTIYSGENISMINLDGGPSTTFYNDHISFNTTDQKLPIWFSICE